MFSTSMRLGRFMRSLQKQFAKAIRAALDAREMIHAVAKAAFAMQHSFLRITFAEKVQRSPEKKYSMNMRINGAFFMFDGLADESGPSGNLLRPRLHEPDTSRDMAEPIAFAELNCWPHRDATTRVEYRWLNAERRDAPIAVFLHEGLGSIALWKDWPQTLCDRLKCRGLVYSRPGYGRSTPRRHDEKWPVEFLHQQAQDVLPALLDALGINHEERKRMWLIGHSDGGTIALLHACAFPDTLAGVAVMAPHLLVEDMTVEAITKARAIYEQGDLRARLAPYHDAVDSAFYGWNDAWLDPAFRAWDITHELVSIRCPLLAIQGEDDEYASMVQIDRIRSSVEHARLVKLRACRHSPHRDAPDAVNDAIAAMFIA
jgi:pimeloyl-ACP methyl ester carboxylesterase